VTPKSRIRWALGAAVLAHAAVIAFAPRAPAPQKPPVTPIELDITEDPVAPEPPTPPEALEPSVTPATARALPRVARSVARPGGAEVHSELPPAAPSTEALTAPPSRSDEAWTFSPSAAGGRGAGGDGALARATAGGVAAAVDEAVKKATRPRKPWKSPEEIARDIDLGLAPGGAYTSLARDAVRNSLTPMNGHALLEFSTDAKGIVLRVRVLDASSDRRSWDDVAAQLEQDAHSAFPLTIPDGAQGLIVTIDVKSALKTISGSSPGGSTFGKIVGAVIDPLDTLADSKAPPQRVVAARIVNVAAY
jgi:hypothetical protein